MFHRLVDDAEEEETKEALLAYYFLLNSPEPMQRSDLDQCIEAWFEQSWNCRIDFEIADAMQKLLALGLVSERDGLLHALPIEKAIAVLDERWDNYFVPPG